MTTMRATTRTFGIAAIVLLVAGGALAGVGFWMDKSAAGDLSDRRAELARVETELDAAGRRLARAEDTLAEGRSTYEALLDEGRLTLRIGKRAARLGEKNCGCNEQMAGITEEQMTAIVAGNYEQFNALVGRFNRQVAVGNRTIEQMRVLIQRLPVMATGM